MGMLLKMGKDPQGYKVQGYYSHMSPADRQIWTRFIEQHPSWCKLVYYDVCVGSIPKEIEGRSEKWCECYGRQTYSKRIDAVTVDVAGFSVIEVKPRGGMVAMGQVMAYRYWLQKIAPAGAKLRGIIVTDKIDEDLVPLLDQVGVEYLEVGSG